MKLKSVFAGVLSLGCLAGCRDDEQSSQVPVRPVRAIQVERRATSEPIVMLGQIKAQDEVNLSFRIDSKLMARLVDIGNQVTVGQVVARIDPQNEQNSLRVAEAELVVTKVSLTQAERTEARQSELLKRGSTSQMVYDQALQQLQSAQAQLDATQARHRIAESRLKYTELEAEVAGTVTAKGAEAGEVIRAGQMILRIARENLKDAVFEVPAQLMTTRQFPSDPVVLISLADRPLVKVRGKVREVAPQADPVTHLFRIKVSLIDPPGEMFLGSSVTGQISLTSPPVMSVPVTALTESSKGKPAVWVFDRQKGAADMREVSIVSFDSSLVVISEGLQDGDIVVTAGVNVLHPGQKVKLLDGSP
jgi:RND family efflux transporter MFP subunit